MNNINKEKTDSILIAHNFGYENNKRSQNKDKKESSGVSEASSPVPPERIKKKEFSHRGTNNPETG